LGEVHFDQIHVDISTIDEQPPGRTPIVTKLFDHGKREAVVARIPPPQGSPEAPLSALIFDAHYDPFRGTVVSCRVFDGVVKPGEVIRLMYNGAAYQVEETGIFRLPREPRPRSA
jgi:translation elongation factor EF-4